MGDDGARDDLIAKAATAFLSALRSEPVPQAIVDLAQQLQARHAAAQGQVQLARKTDDNAPEASQSVDPPQGASPERP